MQNRVAHGAKRLLGDLCAVGPKDLLHPLLTTFGDCPIFDPSPWRSGLQPLRILDIFKVSPVWFGCGFGVGQFERLWFSVPAVPLRKGFVCVCVFQYSLTGKDGSGCVSRLRIWFRTAPRAKFWRNVSPTWAKNVVKIW